MKFLLPSQTSSARGIAFLRIVFGGLVLLHGIQKVLAGQPALQATITAMGIEKADMVSWLVLWGETGLGALLVLGALTRVAGFLAAIMYAGIWFVTESGKPLLSDQPGINAELLILYIALALAFSFLGSGAMSLDRKLFAGKGPRKASR
ncbi:MULTISPECIES: DoxX family protein [Arthrobacter]|uniref:DoxX family protein n=1 Tax=Arthrobacter terricola TaxID=2547396 RepID=A0A4R5KIA9_9MICC|nr:MULTISPECIES: DoxX family protein [Arthrobacter]MBT8161581.1 DoxX family protein [Arthrobacter sp. GN70]TDF95249.1 DoxX family protein [Arthrobacter terricola]